MTKTNTPNIPGSFLNDPLLSFKAKGILTYCLNLEDPKSFSVEGMSAHSNDGPSAIRTGLSEIRQLGYATIERVRSGGKICGCDWFFSGEPIFKE